MTYYEHAKSVLQKHCSVHLIVKHLATLDHAQHWEYGGQDNEQGCEMGQFPLLGPHVNELNAELTTRRRVHDTPTWTEQFITMCV